MKRKLLSLFAVLITSTGFSQCTELFISEVIEGSSNNKAIEIYNPTSGIVDLSTYSIETYFNGSPTTTTVLPLSGNLNSRDVFVVSHASANAAILAQADATVAGGVCNFNGNDAIVLKNNGVIIDVFGEVGSNPGTGWTVSGISNGGQDHSSIRFPQIQDGTTTWTNDGENEWSVAAVDYFCNLGAHVSNSCGTSLFMNAGVNGPFCAGTPINFIALATGGTGTITYAWDFGDCSSLNFNQNPTYTFTNPGTYIVTVVGIDGLFQTAGYALTVTVNPSPTACFSTVVSGNGCEPDTVSFNDCSTGSPASYLWDLDNGSTYTTPTISDEIFQAGNYNLSLTVTNAAGCSDTDIHPISVSATDAATVTYGQSSYCTLDTNPTPTVSGSAGTFSCTTCTVNPSTGELSLAAIAPGTHVIEYTTSGTCPVVVSTTITVTGPADASFTISNSLCENGSSVDPTPVSTGGTWSGTGVTNTTTGTFDPVVAGSGSFYLVHTIPGTCGDKDSVQITVNPVIAPVINSSDTAICNDIFGIFLDAVSGGTWSGVNVTDNGNGNGFFNSAVITPGNYYAVYTQSGNCGGADSILIEVGGQPDANFTFSQTSTTVQLNASVTTNPVYSWMVIENGDTTYLSGSSSTYTYTDPANTLQACLTVTTSLGCSNTLCQSITPTGLADHEKTKISIFPNPVMDGVIYLNGLPSGEKVFVSISDLLGKEVSRKVMMQGENKVDGEFLQSGTYFLRIEWTNNIETHKVIVR